MNGSSFQPSAATVGTSAGISGKGGGFGSASGGLINGGLTQSRVAQGGHIGMGMGAGAGNLNSGAVGTLGNGTGVNAGGAGAGAGAGVGIAPSAMNLANHNRSMGVQQSPLNK